jgi:hypothetical protein
VLSVGGRQHAFGVLPDGGGGKGAAAVVQLNTDEGSGVVAAPVVHKLQRQVRTVMHACGRMHPLDACTLSTCRGQSHAARASIPVRMR